MATELIIKGELKDPKYQSRDTHKQKQKQKERESGELIFEMGKSKVLVVGGTGYIGRRIVKASLAEGHETYVLQRAELGFQIEKLQMLLSFKKQGAHLVQASFSDHNSLVDAVKKVDVVISAISGVHIRTHCISLQLKLIDAIKEAGNIKVCVLFDPFFFLIMLLV